jgi:DNA-binding SARP family transcriptional activator/tetratricopeptide (TPR) repeat protein
MEFAVLGPLDVRSDAESIRLGGRRQRATLTMLLGTPNHSVPAEQLVEAVWAGRPPRTAADNVRLYVHQLRRLLGEDRIVRSAGGYAVVLERDELDVHRFEDLAARGRELLTTDVGAASAVLATALGLWRGPAYADLVEVASVQAEVARLEEQRLAVREARFQAELAQGRSSPIIPELNQQVAADPLRERFRVQLMLALQHDGRPAEALAIYQDGRRVLAEELGLDPGPDLVRIHQAVLTGDLAELAVARSGAALSAGEVGPVPALLPPDIPDFTGRDAELALAQTWLTGRASEALVVVGVAGMAGLGKTTLAVHLAHRLSPEFPDGQLLVNLRGAEAEPVDPADVLARFLRAMGVDSRAIPVDLVERTELYRTRLAGRRMLVVLDNAASEEQVRPLLPGAATCAVLITSRVRLSGLEGARWLDLEQFAPDQAIALLARITRAGRAEAEPVEAAAIVDLCGYLPLAVRIAGARLTARSSWPLAHLVGLLQSEHRRLDQLAAGDLAVRASLALSYDGLPVSVRRLFRLLGRFDAADFPGWLAAAVLDRPLPEANSYLEVLVDAQLLAEAGTDATGRIRYRFHDLVRLYARERAEIEDGVEVSTVALTRGLGGWLAIAERMAPAVPGPCFAPIHGSALRPSLAGHDDVLALDPLLWFDAERSALRTAVHQACRLGLDELAFDLAGCLEKYFDVRGMYEDWQALNEQVMEVCRAAGNQLGEAVMLRGLIDVVTWSGADESGAGMTRLRDEGSRLLEMFRRLGEPAGTADALVICSWGFTAQDQFEPALASATESLELAQQCGHLGGMARAEVALAVLCWRTQQLGDGLGHLTRGLEHARELGNPRYVASVLQFLGMGYLEAGDLDTSHRVLMESLEISRTYRDHYTETFSMLVLARLQLKRGDAGARSAAEAALALGRQYAMTHHIAEALTILGDLELAAGRPVRAGEYLAEAVDLWRTRGWPSFLAATLEKLGRTLIGVDPPAARRAWTEARDIFAELSQQAKVEEMSQLIEGAA